MRKTVITAVLAGLVGALIAAPISVYAAHSFSDVPNTNTFHNDIAWLADAGVTRGCNPPANTEFCPDDDVTRGQMAAFMRRFAEYIDAEDGTPAHAGNASRLNGRNSAYYERPVSMRTGSWWDQTNMSDQDGEIGRVSITAPAGGSVIIEHTSSWTQGLDFSVVVWVEPYAPGAVCDDRTDGDAIAGTWTSEFKEGALGGSASASGAGHVAVTAGTTSYSLCLDTFSGTSNNADWSIQAAWYPTSAADTTSQDSN